MELQRRHQCLIYDGAPSEYLPALAAVVQRRLNDGYRCLYLNSPPMVAGMRSYLSAIGVDVVNETVKARLVLSSENVLLPDGGFDVELMLKKLEDTLDQALNDGHKGLWATGDMTWEFGSEKNLDKLMEYELRLEELMRRRERLCGICQYHRNSLTREAVRQGLLTHRTLFINETLSRINPLFIPFRLPEDTPPTNLELDEAVTALCQMKKAKS